MMNKKYIYLFIFLFVSYVLAESIVFNEYNAQPDANQVTISWITKEETDVRNFLVMRSNDNKTTFNSIAQVNKKGPGYEYRYVDENVFFKDSGIIYYRIDAVNRQGSIVEATETMMVRPNISGIFRTWGAIKAMFR
jgi:hypothetical protein